MRTRDMKGRAGFSLIEVTLALLVMGVGLLAVFGLFGGGLKMNTDSANETSLAFFAQQVMEGAASTNWNDLAVGTELSIPLTASDVVGYSTTGSGEIAAVVLDGTFYRYTLKRESGSTVIEHQTLGYLADIDENQSTNVKSVTLYLWDNPYISPGSAGSFSVEPDATFYREFYNFD